MAKSVDFDARQYWEDRLRSYRGLTGVGYAGLPLTFNRWMYRVRRRIFRRLLRRLDVDIRSARVLDVGSGTGFYLERWLEAGAGAVEGLEISQAAVEELQRRFPDVTFRRADISSPDVLAGMDGRFDAISAMDVVFHIVDDDAFHRAIHNMSAVLKEDGVLIFSDSFLHSPERRLPHIVHRRLEAVRTALGGAGFEVVERRPMFIFMNAPVDTESRLARARWSIIRSVARSSEAMGWLVGALIYPIELLATRTRDESPTTEIMVCRRRPFRASTVRDRAEPGG